MVINVTKHAIQRYRERLFDYSSSEANIVNLIKKIGHNGRLVFNRPSSWGECLEVSYQGISVVMTGKDNKFSVITCLGDTSYRRWVKHQDSHERLKGRILYPSNEQLYG